MLIAPPPGFFFDRPQVASTPFWALGVNMRFRPAGMETIGLFGPVTDQTLGLPISFPVTAAPYRKAFTTATSDGGIVIAGATDTVRAIQFANAGSPTSVPQFDTVHILEPSPLAALSDTLLDPNPAYVQIPPVWWFDDQDDLVVGNRAGGSGEPTYVWDKDTSTSITRMTALSGSPTGAVGGGIINRILVLLGCTSFTDPDPSPLMTIRWSDRFNFEDWTPTDVNISGELQLEGGYRIIGGGFTNFGIVAWTDKRMAILTENGDPDSVFTRRYVDGSRGMLANNAWCEADGQIWWVDENRVLNVFDGGRPRPISNPLKSATIDRIGLPQLSRVFLTANPEYGEIIIHYPDDDANNPDAQIVYNYILNAWSYWRLERSAWHPRVGPMPNVALNANGNVFFHDLDVGVPSAYTSIADLPGGSGISNPAIVPSGSVAIASSALTAFDFAAYTNLITTEDVNAAAWNMTRILADHVPMPSSGAESDEFVVRLLGYGEAEVEAASIKQDYQSYTQGSNTRDFRVGGKALRVGIIGNQVKTVFRFGGFNVSPGQAGER